MSLAAAKSYHVSPGTWIKIFLQEQKLKLHTHTLNGLVREEAMMKWMQTTD